MTEADSVVIRSRRPDDLDAFLILFEAVAAEGRWIGAEAPLPSDRVERIRARAADPPADEIVYIAEAGSVIVGWASVGVDGRGHAGLGMGVLDGWRGRGVGTRLLEQAIEWARARDDVHKLELEVWPHNGPALRLYDRFGFHVEGRRRRHWRRRNGELWDSIVMALVLDETSPGSSFDDADTLDSSPYGHAQRDHRETKPEGWSS